MTVGPHPSAADDSALPILVVDDDVSFLSIVSRSLDQAGWPCVLVERGREAIDLTVQQRFRAVLLDLILPDINGLEVLKALLALPNPPRVVIVSGGATVDSAVTAMRLGAADFIQKPMPMLDLLDVLVPTPSPDVAPSPSEPVSVLATLIMAVAYAPTDTRTLKAWAALVHVSEPSLVRKCLRVGLHAKQALDLGRLMRVVRMQSADPQGADALECADERTVSAMLGRAGLRRGDLRWLSVDAFLGQQQLVRHVALIDALRRRVS